MGDDVPGDVGGEFGHGALLFMPFAREAHKRQDGARALGTHVSLQTLPAEALQQALRVFPGGDLCLRLFDFRKERGVRQDEPFFRSRAARIRAGGEHVELAAPQPPRALKGVFPRRRRCAVGRRGSDKLRSVVGIPTAEISGLLCCGARVAEEVAEIADAAALVRVRAAPWGEQQGFEEGVLLCVLLHRWALEAVDCGHVDAVQHDLLRVGARQRIVRLEEEKVGSLRAVAPWPAHAAHIHPIDVEGHASKLPATVRVVVGRVCARGAGLHLFELVLCVLDVAGGGFRARALEGHGLHCLVRGGRCFLDGVVVEQPLALLQGPLQLAREDARVVVALQAVAVREDVHHEFRGGKPEAAIGHGGQADGHPAGATRERFQRLALFPDRLNSAVLLRRLGLLPRRLGFLLLLGFLPFEAVNAVRHGPEKRGEGLHGFALILRDVEIHGSRLLEGRGKASDAHAFCWRQARRACEPCRALPRGGPEGAQKLDVPRLRTQATALQRSRRVPRLRLRRGLSSTAQT